MRLQHTVGKYTEEVEGGKYCYDLQSAASTCLRKGTIHSMTQRIAALLHNNFTIMRTCTLKIRYGGVCYSSKHRSPTHACATLGGCQLQGLYTYAHQPNHNATGAHVHGQPPMQQPHSIIMSHSSQQTRKATQVPERHHHANLGVKLHPPRAWAGYGCTIANVATTGCLPCRQAPQQCRRKMLWPNGVPTATTWKGGCDSGQCCCSKETDAVDDLRSTQPACFSE
jgi:hypothetical protein